MNRKIIKEILHNEKVKYSPNGLRIFMNKHNDIKLFCEYVYNKNKELWETPLNVLKCIYRFDNDGSTDRFSYGVITFMTWDFPIINQVIKLPIFSKTDRMYKF